MHCTTCIQSHALAALSAILPDRTARETAACQKGESLPNKGRYYQIGFCEQRITYIVVLIAGLWGPFFIRNRYDGNSVRATIAARFTIRNRMTPM